MVEMAVLVILYRLRLLQCHLLFLWGKVSLCGPFYANLAAHRLSGILGNTECGIYSRLARAAKESWH